MKEKLENKRKLARERSKGYIQTEIAIPIDVASTPAFPNRMAKKHAVGQLKKSMPDTPEKKAELVATITESPRTRKVLEKRGLVRTPEEEKEVVALEALASDLSKGLKAVKRISLKEQGLHLLLQNHYLLDKMSRNREARKRFQSS